MLNSLRAKITLGYYLVGVLIIGMAAVALFELRLVQAKIAAGAAIAEFLEVSLEVRRFEKNFFLYREARDLVEQGAYLERAHALLDNDAFHQFAGDERLAELRGEIARYERHMREFAEQVDDPARRRVLEPLIRQDGKRVIDFAEDAARRERALLQASLDKHQRNLLLSIGVLVLLILPVGQFVAWRIARPLKQLERHMARVALGHREPLRFDSTDREIVSLRDAFGHMLAELEQRQKNLVRSEKLASLGTLLSGVAHELNNPLSNISSSAQILLEDQAAMTPAQRQAMLAQIDEQTERARRIVRALLDFARDRPIRAEPVPLRELVEQTLDFLKGVVPPTVTVNVIVAPGLTAHADGQRLQQVLLNLVKNAVEAMHGKGQICIEARRAHIARSGGGEPTPGVELEIADNGPGIPPATLARIFDPFFTTKDVGRGSGLGLYVAHEIIEEHGGSLTADSWPGEGTRFRILLPDGPAVAPTSPGTPP